MNIDVLVQYLSQNNLSDTQAHYLSQLILNLQDEKEQALNDISRLEIEHRLSYEEAERLFSENKKALNEIEVLQKKLHLSKTEVEAHFEEKEKLKQEANNFVKERDETSSKIEKLKQEADNFAKERDEALSEISRLELKQRLTQISFDSMKSDLDKSRSECISLEGKLIECRYNIVNKLSEKASLQVDLSESQARLELVRAENADLILKSNTEIIKFKQDKEKMEALVLQIQADLEQSRVEQEKLFKRIRKLDIEAFELNLEGLSDLFELQKDHNYSHTDCKITLHSFNPANVANDTHPLRLLDSIQSRHIKEKTKHEYLVFTVDNLIQNHYERRGLGKSISNLRRHFPDSCIIS